MFPSPGAAGNGRRSVLIVLVVVAILFSSLTVEVGDNELRWHFGPGLWTYRLPPQGLANALQSPARRA
jgi:hypothetical protein